MQMDEQGLLLFTKDKLDPHLLACQAQLSELQNELRAEGT